MGLFFQKREEAPDQRWEQLNNEYQNYRRRTALELEERSGRSARKTAAAFLPIYDDLQRALEASCSDPAFYKGVELIQRELMSVFASLKIKPMESKGKIFNPTYHEAVEHITDPQYRKEEIVEVLQVGFTMDEEVIRHARVVVANCE